MKERALIISALILLSIIVNSQVVVNGVDLNKEVEAFEVWAFKKPFSQKESLFINYGQDGFRSVNYDSKKQSVFNKDGVKFMKGEYLKLHLYLKDQGWIKTSERETSMGNNEGRVIMFEKKKE